MLRALRRAGKEVFLTYRMNDVHNPDAPDQWNTSRFKREHPDAIVDPRAVREKHADWMCYCLDYSREDVQDYILATMRELVDLYGGEELLDGIQLDWMRFPRHLSGAPEEVWGKREALTRFTTRVRELLASARRPLQLAARIPTSLDGCRALGIDVAAWAERGLVDWLAASPFLTTDFAMPLAEMRRAMGGRPVPLYAAMDFGHGPQNHSPESLRAAALGLYGSGADGIYLFNQPCWIEYLAARPYHWLPGLATPESAARKPLLFSLSHRLHRVPGVDLPWQLPADLDSGAELVLTLVLPQAALPAWRALFLVASGGDIVLSLNGQALPELPALRRAQLFVEHVDPAAAPAQHPRGEDCRVFRADPSLLRAGENTLRVANQGSAEVTINRASLGLW